MAPLYGEGQAPADLQGNRLAALDDNIQQHQGVVAALPYYHREDQQEKFNHSEHPSIRLLYLLNGGNNNVTARFMMLQQKPVGDNTQLDAAAQAILEYGSISEFYRKLVLMSTKHACEFLD